MAGSLRSSWWTLYELWPMERVVAFERACDQVESAWLTGSTPDVYSILETVDVAQKVGQVEAHTKQLLRPTWKYKL